MYLRPTWSFWKERFQVPLLGLCLKNGLGIQNNIKSESPSPKLGPNFLRKWYLTQQDIDWIKGPSQGLRPTWLQFNWSPSSRLEAHMTFLELKSDLAWIKAQVQGLRFTSLCLNWSPSSTLEALMTLLESRPKSNIWDSNDFNKFKTQVQRLEPIQSFWKKRPKPKA